MMNGARWFVVGIDFSRAAERALERAAELACQTGANLACVHAYVDPPNAPLESDQSATLCSLLDGATRFVCSRFPELTVRCFVRRGAPWEKLVNVAWELGAELIVVGASGENARLEPRFLGTVTARVAVLSERAVLVVPAQELGAWNSYESPRLK